jgi:hypothetical protein
MKRTLFSILLGAAFLAFIGAAGKEDRSKTYNIVADDIEACSCPLFCPCYFNTEPANPHMCEFNNVYEFRKGSHYGATDLSGAKVWASGDLGGEALSEGKAKYIMVSFDKKTTPAQREAIGKIFGKMFPISWGKMETREDDIEFHHTDGNDHAKLGSGMGEVTLKRGNWESTKAPTEIKGLKYFGTDSNDGFVMAKSTHYFHGQDLSFDLEGRNGFFVTVRMHGKIDAAPAAGSR